MSTFVLLEVHEEGCRCVGCGYIVWRDGLEGHEGIDEYRLVLDTWRTSHSRTLHLEH